MPLFKKINKAQNRLVVLIAPLDWGLGHATRCIPVINEFLSHDCEVIVAAEGNQRALLQEEFPSIRFVGLKGYGVKYGRSGLLTFLRLIAQVPFIYLAIRREHRWLTDFLKVNKVDLIISDNRYGLHTENTPCIFITHQLLIKTSLGRAVDELLQPLNYKLISRFSLCWVPDYESQSNLAGDLSHPKKLPPIPVQYLGALSRLKADRDPTPPFNELLVVLSGPEPSRSLFEMALLDQLQHIQVRTIFIRGVPGNKKFTRPVPANVKICNHAGSKMLGHLVSGSRFILCRSGYSSIMDFLPKGKKCILIPTPGQPEQAYLAKYLWSKRYCLAYSQTGFSLQQALSDASSFSPSSFPADQGKSFQQIIAELCNQFER